MGVLCGGRLVGEGEAIHSRVKKTAMRTNSSKPRILKNTNQHNGSSVKQKHQLSRPI